MTRINVYLTFNDNCREAMNFYKAGLGGELTIITVGESAMAEQMPPQMKDLILHSSLQVGDSMVMASDLKRQPLTDGNTTSICINCENENDMKRFFKNLAEGGTITQDIMEMPGGAKIGDIVDKFGKQWIFYYDKNEQQ